ncbi:DNA mismatch repair protein MSH6 [Nematocida major]|uniref:DNA mismatch repair protein MSH6 n=1 Tax=Nematocida major TaxID=1912982 RepID=UPI002007B8B7|nr:DNA mismatch repair protein MSH6 [Nematocida major]KAH9386850.1 DNA mismatch repair protein MSH6 [Nematocida major]
MPEKVRKCGILAWAKKRVSSPVNACAEEEAKDGALFEPSQESSSAQTPCAESTDLSQSSVRDAEETVGQLYSKKAEHECEQRMLPFLSPPKDKFGRTPADAEYDKSTLFIPESDLSAMTPCEQQFWRIKMNYFDTVVFFKKGKFYEMFEEDAAISAELFGLKLTRRGLMRMTGVPEMALEMWLDKFLHKGYKVSIVDQKETSVSQNMRVKSGDAKQKIIERELKEVVTEVTTSTEGAGICSLFVSEIPHTGKVSVQMAVLRPMESEIFAVSFEDDEELFKVKSVVKRENIRDILTDSAFPGRENIIKIRQDVWDQNVSDLMQLLDTQKMEAAEISAVKVLLSYLKYLKYTFAPKAVEYSERSREYMHMDGRTIEMLCLLDGPEKGERAGKGSSLLQQINQTKTKQGKRLLRKWIIHPLACIEKIEKRQNTVQALENAPERGSIEACLGKIHDINDYIKKAKNHKIRPEEIRRLVSTLEAAGSVCALLEKIESTQETENSCVGEIRRKLQYFPVGAELVAGFDTAGEIMPLETDPDLLAAEKHKQKVLRILDEYAKRESLHAGRNFVVKKIGREHVLECKQQERIPHKYIPSGSTKTTARYTTPELRKLSESFLEAEEKISFLSTESISRISQRIGAVEEELKSVSLGAAELDCFLSLAHIRGARAELADEFQATGITNIKHTHIRNSLEVQRDNKIVVITGPNMAGKSTFLRNAAISIVLRQIGARVPAESFRAPVYDRVFTRIGGADNLFEGESTFQVEMKETAEILSNATEKSFVIIDELGRGTSTAEGAAISLAVKEYLKKLRCTALYATHFFSAILETDVKKKMDYQYMLNASSEREIVYTYKLVDGVCEDSCGIDICKITKVPRRVIQRATEIKEARASRRSTYAMAHK